LYFEPLTLEDVLAIVEREKPQGVIVQFGGQTPLNLALELKRNGVPIIGTTPESIDLAEDRRRFGRLLEELKITQPRNGTALIPEEAARVAGEIGMPVLVRPSYVLGGRAMVIAYDVNTVQEYVAQAAMMGPARPVLIDQFLEEATEVDVDALADGTDVVIGGIMEHIEEAGVHSGDSSCVLPPVSLTPAVRDPARHGVCAGSQSARIAHCTVCQQGDGRATGESSGAFDGREEIGGYESSARAARRRFRNCRARILFREVAGVSV
jgi:carbamoyl-phosphate synthase large subunit